MAGWTKLERRKVTEWRNGAVYRTKVVGWKWFAISDQPKPYVTDPDGFLWVATSDYHFGPAKPPAGGAGELLD